MNGTPRVVVTRHLLPSIEARMRELFDSRLNPDDRALSHEELQAAIADCDVLVPTVTDTIDTSLIESAGDRLKLIASFGAGTDHIDLAAAAKRGIMVTNTPGVFTDDTADLTMAMIIGVPRRIREGTSLVRQKEWTGWAPSALLGRQLGGKILGIVGMGRIGQAVAHRARAFGLEIHYHNLDEMLGRSDIVTLHCPASPETHGLIDAGRIAAMKPGSALVNTARGDLVDYEALISALQEGRLSGAGLDVFPQEPEIDPRLLAHPNVIALPHIGSATIEGREASGEKVITNIRFWADGHRPPDQVLDALV